MKKLFKLIRGNRLLYLMAILSVGAATFLAMLVPMVTSITIDSIIGNKPVSAPGAVVNFVAYLGGRSVLSRNLWICSLCLIFITAVRGIFLYLRGRLSAKASENIARDIRVRLYDHLQNLPYDYHIKAESGDLIQRCTSDVETIRRFFANQLVEIGRAVFMVTFALIMMLTLNKKMTLISMITVPIIFLFSFIYFSKIKTTFEEADKQEGKMTSVLQENLSGVRVVKAFGRESFEIEKFEEQNNKFKNLNFRVVRLMSTYWSVSDLLCTVQIGLVLFFGIYYAVKGNISLGTLVVFNTYEDMLLWPVRQLGRILSDMGKMTVSLKRVTQILDVPVEADGGLGLTPEIKGNIIFNDVKFQYKEDVPILDGVSFEAKQGETIAIMGSTGSGKSSLMHLLPRLYDYQDGSIKVDGVELSDINRKWIRKNIGIVLQEPFLYSRTIKENIKMPKKDAEDAEIETAASIADVHDVIASFEKGYDTLVGEKGVTLSGGQRQRVAIARTLINDTPILIFDDSLSAVDAETDKIIREKLNKRSKGVTTFIISHRINTVKDADKILVLQKGKIVQAGKHEELIRIDGLYKRIWQIQNSTEEAPEDKACNE